MRSARLIAPLASLALLCCTGVALAASLSKAQYTGTTSDQTVVRLRLSSSGHRVAKFRIFYMVNCDDNQSHKTFTDIFGLRIARDGTFAGSGSYKGQEDGSINRFRVSGKVTKSRARGRFSLRATGTLPSGQTVHCQTGRISYTADRVR